MTPEIIYVENGNKPVRNDRQVNPWASQPGTSPIVATRPRADSAENKSWYLRSCRYQLIDRLMILACLITSVTLASWTIAQESSASSQEATSSSEATVITDEATSDEPAQAADKESDKASSEEASSDKASSDKASSDKASTEDPATDEAATDEAATDEAATDEATTDDQASDSAKESERVAPLAAGDVESINSESIDSESIDSESIDDDVARVLEDGPAWVDNPPEASDGFEAIVVASDPKVTHEDALASLDAKIQETLERYIDDYLGVPHAHTYLPFDLDHYKSRLILEEGDRYDKVATYSVGTMHESYAKLTIDSQFRQDIHHRWHEVVTSMRLFRTGGIVAGVLALMLVVFSYLRLDTATRGYYSGRLRMLGGLAILGLIGLAAYFFRYNLEWLQMLING